MHFVSHADDNMESITRRFAPMREMRVPKNAKL